VNRPKLHQCGKEGVFYYELRSRDVKRFSFHSIMVLCFNYVLMWCVCYWSSIKDVWSIEEGRGEQM